MLVKDHCFKCSECADSKAAEKAAAVNQAHLTRALMPACLFVLFVPHASTEISVLQLGLSPGHGIASPETSPLATRELSASWFNGVPMPEGLRLPVKFLVNMLPDWMSILSNSMWSQMG